MPHGRSLLAVLAIALPMLLPAAAGAATISSSTATFTDELSDNGTCSLREMVQIANTDNAAVEDACTVTNLPLGADTIQLASGTPYVLGGAANENANATGDLDISDADGLTIVGAGTALSILDGADNDRLIHATSGALTLQQLTARNGQVTALNGGGILSSVPLALNGTRVTGNDTVTSGSGGGIVISGAQLTLTDSVVDLNTSASGGGGIQLGGSASLTANGATSISDNTAAGEGGGINASTLNAGDITLNPGSLVQGNDATAQGGGINHTSGATDADVTIDGAMISGNGLTAVNGPLSGGGGVRFNAGFGTDQQLVISGGTQITGNTVAGQEATGGGLSLGANSGSVSIADSRVSSNAATVSDDADAASEEGGGGVFVTGAAPVDIVRSTIDGNNAIVNDPDDAAHGGGILALGGVQIDSSTVSGNSATGGNTGNANFSPAGGGLFTSTPVTTASTSVVNSTFSGNSLGNAGATLGGGIAGAINSHSLTVAFSTFADNSSQLADAISIGGAPLSNLTLIGVLIDEGANGCFPVGLSEDSNSYNVDGGTSCVGTNADTDVQSFDAPLGLLQDNGGATLTHALAFGSGVEGLVPQSVCEAQLGTPPNAVDQRGVERDTAVGCDPGSFEAFASPPPPTTTPPTTTPPPTTTTPIVTGQRARAIRKCKKKFPKGPKRKRCIRRAKRLPV